MATKTQPKPKSKITVWGLAAGHGTTAEAAPGAFTWREYPDEASIPQEDWRHIIRIDKEH